MLQDLQDYVVEKSKDVAGAQDKARCRAVKLSSNHYKNKFTCYTNLCGYSKGRKKCKTNMKKEEE